MNTLFWTFVGLNALNVIIQTVKSLVTIKGGKWTAAITNAVAYGLYTIVVVYMVCELPLVEKAVIIGLCNLVGVFIVKTIEEKKRKDRVWKIETTMNTFKDNCDGLIKKLEDNKISFNTVKTEKYMIINCYAVSKEDSRVIKKILEDYNAKYFASETKYL